jgi:phosphate transport system substrate-binding protein
VAALTWSLIALAAGAALAAEVTLSLKGGGFQVTGDLKGYDGRRFTVANPALGTMTLDASRFDCTGPGCPPPASAAPPGQRDPAAVRAAALAPIAGPAGRLAIAGSATIGERLMPALIEGYAASSGLKATRLVGTNPVELRYRLSDPAGREVGLVELRRPGTDQAFAELERKTAHLGMASRQARPDELARLRTAGLGDLRTAGRESVLALDGLVAIVSSQNSAVSISIDNLAKIFAGTLTDWSELGLPAASITPIAPKAGTGTLEVFERMVLAPRGIAMAASVTRADAGAIAEAVARDSQAIGIVPISSQGNAKLVNIEASCGLVTRPSVFALKTEEYPLSRRLYLYSAPAPAPSLNLQRGLLQFALSPAAQPIIRDADFVDQLAERLPFDAQTSRVAYALSAQNEDFDLELMKQLITELNGAERLSITFRFLPGAITLDARAQQDVGRLRALMESPELRGRQLVLAGFADAQGRFDQNLLLAQRRVAAVQRALGPTADRTGERAAAIVRAYGELAPVACNDTDAGRALNRRVEIWLKR